MRRLMILVIAMVFLCAAPIARAENILDQSVDIVISMINLVLPTVEKIPELTPKLKRERDCLAQNIYFEAGHESYEGKLAVAQVTRNRVESGLYPDTYCAVVWQQAKNKKTGKKVAQFSWTLDGKPDIPKNKKAYEEALEIAEEVLLYGKTSDIIGKGVMHYHAVYVKPAWARRLQKVVRVDRHIFYTNAT